MGAIVTIGAIFISVGINIEDEGVIYAGILLIGGQAILAYFISGVSKAASASWRSGAAVKGVMQTETFGNQWAGILTSKSHYVSLLAGWIVISTEMLFPLAIISPTPVLIFCIIGFTLFHISNAFFMGLNSFIFVFLATYPSIIKINHDLRDFLGILQ